MALSVLKFHWYGESTAIPLDWLIGTACEMGCKRICWGASSQSKPAAPGMLLKKAESHSAG